jgi:hypothetical protein
LHVTGECTVGSPGHQCELKIKEPQGTNPADLLLDLVIAEPTSPQPEVMTPCPVRFEYETDARYDTVSIVGVQSSIPVKEVS